MPILDRIMRVFDQFIRKEKITSSGLFEVNPVKNATLYRTMKPFHKLGVYIGKTENRRGMTSWLTSRFSRLAEKSTRLFRDDLRFDSYKRSL